jgi:hypothetical protein
MCVTLQPPRQGYCLDACAEDGTCPGGSDCIRIMGDESVCIPRMVEGCDE